MTVPHVHASMQGADLDPGFSLAHNFPSSGTGCWSLLGFCPKCEGQLAEVNVEWQRNIKQHLLKDPREGTEFMGRFSDRCPRAMFSFVQGNSKEHSHLKDKVPRGLCPEAHKPQSTL